MDFNIDRAGLDSEEGPVNICPVYISGPCFGDSTPSEVSSSQPSQNPLVEVNGGSGVEALDDVAVTYAADAMIMTSSDERFSDPESGPLIAFDDDEPSQEEDLRVMNAPSGAAGSHEDLLDLEFEAAPRTMEGSYAVLRRVHQDLLDLDFGSAFIRTNESPTNAKDDLLDLAFDHAAIRPLFGPTHDSLDETSELAEYADQIDNRLECGSPRSSSPLGAYSHINHTYEDCSPPNQFDVEETWTDDDHWRSAATNVPSSSPPPIFSSSPGMASSQTSLGGYDVHEKCDFEEDGQQEHVAPTFSRTMQAMAVDDAYEGEYDSVQEIEGVHGDIPNWRGEGEADEEEEEQEEEDQLDPSQDPKETGRHHGITITHQHKDPRDQLDVSQDITEDEEGHVHSTVQHHGDEYEEDQLPSSSQDTEAHDGANRAVVEDKVLANDDETIACYTRSTGTDEARDGSLDAELPIACAFASRAVDEDDSIQHGAHTPPDVVQDQRQVDYIDPINVTCPESPVSIQSQSFEPSHFEDPEVSVCNNAFEDPRNDGPEMMSMECPSSSPFTDFETKFNVNAQDDTAATALPSQSEEEDACDIIEISDKEPPALTVLPTPEAASAFLDGRADVDPSERATEDGFASFQTLHEPEAFELEASGDFNFDLARNHEEHDSMDGVIQEGGGDYLLDVEQENKDLPQRRDDAVDGDHRAFSRGIPSPEKEGRKSIIFDHLAHKERSKTFIEVRPIKETAADPQSRLEARHRPRSAAADENGSVGPTVHGHEGGHDETPERSNSIQDESALLLPWERNVHSKDGAEEQKTAGRTTGRKASPRPTIPVVPNPKRPTPAGQLHQHKKLSKPFRCPTISTPVAKAVGASSSGSVNGASATNASVSVAQTKEEPPKKEDVKIRHRTQRASAQFKSPLTLTSTGEQSLVRPTPTIQALEIKAQTLKRALRVVRDKEEETLKTLIAKWLEGGREVAYELWTIVKDSAIEGDGSSGGDAGGGLSRKRKLGESWGWDDGSDRKKPMSESGSSWGWDPAPVPVADDNDVGEHAEGGHCGESQQNEEGDGEEKMPETTGTMLMRLGICPTTLGWDEEEGCFVV